MPQFSRKYEQNLWESGIASIHVLQTTVDTEVQLGNHRNIPIDIFCLYILTCACQLEQLEMEEGTFEDRAMKAEQLIAGIQYIKARDDERGQMCIDHVLNELKNRECPMPLMPNRDTPMALTDLTYGGRLPFGDKGPVKLTLVDG